VSWPGGTVKEAVVVAPLTGSLVLVELEEVPVVEVVDGAVVVAGASADWCLASEQLAATMATTISTPPTDLLPFVTDRGWWPEACGRARRRRRRATA
jgi:hypothetical protein